MPDELLSQLIQQNNELTELETEVAEARNKRNETIRRLRTHRVTVRKLSDVLGISEQSIHKIIKGQK